MTARTLVGSTIALIVAIAIIPVHAAAIWSRVGAHRPEQPSLRHECGGRPQSAVRARTRRRRSRCFSPAAPAPTALPRHHRPRCSPAASGACSASPSTRSSPSNRRFFVNYTRQTDGATVIAEYRAFRADPNSADLTEKLLLAIAQPFSQPQWRHAGVRPRRVPLHRRWAMAAARRSRQPCAGHRRTLLGKILRIDVDRRRRPYSIPPNNPFVDGDGRPMRSSPWHAQPLALLLRPRGTGQPLRRATSVRARARRSTS